MSSLDVKLSPYEQLRNEVLTFLSEELFAKFLPSPQTKPLHEILFFDDIDAVKSRIVGSPRQAVLRALKDPHYYLDVSISLVHHMVAHMLALLPLTFFSTV